MTEPATPYLRHFHKLRIVSGLLSGTALLAFAPQVAAQDVDPAAASPATTAEEGIVVSGIRETIQNSIATKRNSTEIVDALSSEDIGNLPALSIGEALETLTGAASHRDQGTATEIAIRGLGPFLSSTTINGRLASNGSGDRSVNFSQFPSELFNKVAIYKTQSASQIEGGVAGQITLDSVRPIDYGKNRVQTEFKVNYNPDNNEIDSNQRFRDFGYRGTVSYIDQFDVGGGEMGISLGYSRNVTTNPEQEANVSNTLNYCRNDPTSTSAGVGDDNNCDTNSPRPAVAGTEDFVIGRNSYSYRQNITEDKRDSFFGALQYQPTSDIDINVDFQYSRRKFRERRNDLNFSEGRRVDDVNDAVFSADGTTGNRLPFDLIVGPGGELRQFTGETSIETNSEYIERDEKYYGGGFALDVQATDKLRLSTDISYSRTQRIEEATQVRMRIRDQLDIFGNGGNYPLSREPDGTTSNDRIETAYLVQQNGSETLNFVVREFDVNNHDLFRDNARARYDLEQDRFNSIFAARGDFEYEMDGLFSTIEGGVRYQDLKYRDVPGAAPRTSRTEVVYSNAALAIANQRCRTVFPENDFMGSLSGGNPLVTNVDSAGNVISTTNTFATFDALCLAQVLETNDPSGQITFDENGVPNYPTGDFDSVQNSDVTEKTWAGYVQANFDSDLGNTPIRGNLGLRVINTKVRSVGLRTTLSTDPNAPVGTVVLIEDLNNFTSETATSSYTEFLPSFNLVADLTPEVSARFAVFRALSRPDPSALGFGRSFDGANDDTDPTTVVEALGVVTANGNPLTQPLLSWNFDVALEWYPNPDSIFAVGAYYKRFNGGFETFATEETFLVDGQPVNAFVNNVRTTEESSTIYGVEATAAHRFSYLPKPLDGLGFKVSYNYANSNFEFQDDTLGAITSVDIAGNLTTSEALIPAADIFGLSKHVLSAQVYYDIGKLSLQGVYKYRSDYFQQFVADPGRIRYVGDVEAFEARISYDIAKNVRLSLEGLNLFNDPRFDYRGTPSDLGSASVFGARYFLGIRAKF